MIGDVLGGKYKLLSLLGRGGMGAVYAATCEDTASQVAVKVLHHHLTQGEAASRFRREAEAARRITSKHIVRIIDAGTCSTTGHHYLVTELLHGNDLQHWLDRLGPLSIHGALRLTLQALQGLRRAHAAWIVHRDIKPGNLFLAKNPNNSMTLKILDFGIAKVHRDSVLQGATTNVTATGSLLGSPLYMSPEQVQDSRKVDARTDIWALGSVLYAALSGRAPHQHLSSVGQLLVAICVHKARPLVEVAPWVPAEVAAIVHRALEIDPAMRYPNADAMLSDIEKWVTDGEILEEDLLSSGNGFRAVYISSSLPNAEVDSERIVVGSGNDKPIEGNEVTLAAGVEFSQTELQPRAIERSAVPKLESRVAGRHVTVDPRRLVGEKSELWTYSLDVHRDISTLMARIWKALRRAGVKLPPMTYGTEWVLYEPRTRRYISNIGLDGAKLSLEDAGIRSGAVLWIVRPEAQKTEANSDS